MKSVRLAQALVVSKRCIAACLTTNFLDNKLISLCLVSISYFILSEDHDLELEKNGFSVIFSEFPVQVCFEASNEFLQKRRDCTGDHHCGHYSSAIRTDTREELSKKCIGFTPPCPDENFKYGDWPATMPFYSRSCPSCMTWFR